MERSDVYVISDPGEQKRVCGWKSIQTNNDRKFPKFGKSQKSTNSRRWWNPDRINTNKFVTRHTIIELLKTKDKEKYPKAMREKTSSLYRNNKSNDNGFFIRNHGTTRNHGSRSTFSSAKRKNKNC